MTAAELERLAEELGIDAIGAAPAQPYTETERHIAERAGARALRRPEVHDGAAGSVLSPGDASPGRADGRLRRRSATTPTAPSPSRVTAASRATRGATPTQSFASASTQLGRRLGGDYRVLVDANQHVDREAAARSGVGFYGKNTMLITRKHGSWVVLGTLVTTVELEPTPTSRPRLRLLPPLHRRLPDQRARRAGRPRHERLPLVLDAVADIGSPSRSAWRSRTGSTAATSARTSAPGTAASRSAAPARSAARRRDARLARRLARGGGRRAARPIRAPLRPAQRPALPASQRARRAGEQRGPGAPRTTRSITPDSDDELLREHAEWALARLDARQNS